MENDRILSEVKPQLTRPAYNDNLSPTQQTRFGSRGIRVVGQLTAAAERKRKFIAGMKRLSLLFFALLLGAIFGSMIIKLTLVFGLVLPLALGALVTPVCMLIFSRSYSNSWDKLSLALNILAISGVALFILAAVFIPVLPATIILLTSLGIALFSVVVKAISCCREPAATPAPLPQQQQQDVAVGERNVVAGSTEQLSRLFTPDSSKPQQHQQDVAVGERNVGAGSTEQLSGLFTPASSNQSHRLAQPKHKHTHTRNANSSLPEPSSSLLDAADLLVDESVNPPSMPQHSSSTHFESFFSGGTNHRKQESLTVKSKLSSPLPEKSEPADTYVQVTIQQPIKQT